MGNEEKTWLELLPKHILEQWQKSYENNLHHIKARDILKDAIQQAIENPSMTPEVKSAGEIFLILLDETGNSFKYDADAVLKPVIDIARVEIPSAGGTARAKNDKKTDYLNEIEKEAIARAEQFKRYGYQADFVRKMLAKYTELQDDKAIKTRLSKLAKDGKIEPWRKE